MSIQPFPCPSGTSCPICGMLEERMRKLLHPGSERSLPYLAGLLLCALLLAFAVTSKAAAYYPHNPGARPITSAKIWLQQDRVTKYVLPTVKTTPTHFVVVFTIAVIAAIVRYSTWMQTSTVFSPALELFYRTAHSIRPPPRS